MKDKDVSYQEDLRQRAKALLQGKSVKTDDLSNESVEWLIHELQVHQTELVLQNEALQEAQLEISMVRDQYTDLFDFAPNGYFIFDKYGRILNINLTACQMLKMERRSLIDQPFARFLSDPDKDNFYLHRQKVLKSSKAQFCQLTFNTGTDSILEGKLESIRVREPEGKTLQIRSSLVDVTEINQVRALEKREKRLRQLLEAAAEGIILVDEQGLIQMINASVEKIFDYDEKELVGEHINLVIPSAWGQQLPSTAGNTDRFKRVRRDLKGLSKNDREFPLRISISSFKHFNQRYFTFFVTDLTEQVRIEQELIESRENYRILFEHSPVSIWEVDFSEVKRYLDQLKSSRTTDFRNYFINHPEEARELASMVKVVDINHTSLLFFGAESREAIVNKKLKDWFDQDSWSVFQEELIQLAEGKSQFGAEITVRVSKRLNKNLLMNLIVPPQYVSTLEKVIISFIDITALKEAELALIEEIQTNERYLQVANSIVLVIDIKGKILLINQKGEEILGYSKQDIIGKNWFDKFIPKQKRFELIEAHRLVTSGITKNGEFYENEILTKGGEVRTIEWHNAAIFDENGRNVSVISSGVDVTLRKKAEAATLVAIHKGQDQERQRIAQELHDGLSQQLAATKMLLSSLEPDLENIDPASQEIYRNVLDILDQTVQDVRRISHNLVPIALSGSGIFATIKELCSKAGVVSNVKINFEKSGDDQKIDQPLAITLYRITQELLNNILKHAEATTAKIYISQQKDVVTLNVQDNGKGIETDEYLTHGIGLKNIRSRLQGLQGSISIDSSRETGTEIKIVAPVHLPDI